jgi:hypothetical protein
MLPRRTFLTQAAATIVLTGAMMTLRIRPSFAQSALDRATDFVKSTGNQLIAVINGNQSPADKRQTTGRWT